MKRAFDIIVSSVALIVFSPVLIVLAVSIKITSPGEILFRQVRIGQGGQTFRIYKFRSMLADAEALGGYQTQREDPRVTPVGRFIRGTSIDELPQLINVLKGEMSIVGPRPPLPSEVDRYEVWQRKRFEVLPGLTGLAQINGRSDLGFDETLRYDFYYIENWSPLLDLKIMLKTIPKVALAKGAY